MQAFKLSRFMLKLVFCLVAFNGGFFILAWASNFSISNENGPIEIFQVLILGLVFVTYALSISKQEGATQTLGVAFSYVCLFLFLKELDFRELQILEPGQRAQWVENTIPEQIRKFIKFIKFSSLLLFIGFLISRYRDMVRTVMSWTAWPYFLSFALLLLSQALEHKGFRNPEGLQRTELLQAIEKFQYSQAIGKFHEELIELITYLVFLYATLSSAAISCFRKCPELSRQTP
jgi:hypothetical protein